MVAAARCGLVRVGSGSSLRRKPSGGGWRRRASQGGARHEQWVMAQGVARMRRGAAARACAVAWALACKEGRRRAAAERRVVAAVWRARRRLRLQVARRRNQCRQRMRGGGWQAGARALQKRLVPGGFCAGRCGSPAGRRRPTGGGPPAASSSLLRAAALHAMRARAAQRLGLAARAARRRGPPRTQDISGTSRLCSTRASAPARTAAALARHSAPAASNENRTERIRPAAVSSQRISTRHDSGSHARAVRSASRPLAGPCGLLGASWWRPRGAAWAASSSGSGSSLRRKP